MGVLQLKFQSAVLNLKSKIFGSMSIFSKIIAGEIPSYKIAENEKFFAFLDIAPLVEGHVLVVPKIEADKIFDVPDDYLAELLLFAKPIAKAIEASFSSVGLVLQQLGLKCHMHIYIWYLSIRLMTLILQDPN